MPAILDSLEIVHRDELPLLCEWRRFETVVEIGVDRGIFSEMFMSRARGLRHYIGVDPYQSTDEFPAARDGDIAVAAIRYAKYPTGSLLRMTSAQFADSLRNGELGHIKERCVDLVYIDAGHTYEDAQRDIAEWWPLVSDKGILAGHDYDYTHPGVMQAVQEFSDREGVNVMITREHPNSWYCYKNRNTMLSSRYPRD